MNLRKKYIKLRLFGLSERKWKVKENTQTLCVKFFVLIGRIVKLQFYLYHKN